MVGTVATDGLRMLLKEGATALQLADDTVGGSLQSRVSPSVIVTPSAGTHTYKVAIIRWTGTGTAKIIANATYPAYILVEDITGAVWPVGSTVTAGMVASEAWTPFTPVVKFGGTTATVGTNDTRYIRVGRLITVNYAFILSNLNGGSGSISITVPTPVRATVPSGIIAMPLGMGGIERSSSGAVYAFAACQASGAVGIEFRTTAVPTVQMTTLAPFTLAVGAPGTGDSIYATITYEAAS